MPKARTGMRCRIHRYYKLEDELWHCADCSHYVPSNIPQSYIIGRESICWGCRKEFKLGEDNIRQDRPICFNCITGIKPKAVERIEDALEEILREAKQKKEQEEYQRKKNESNELNK